MEFYCMSIFKGFYINKIVFYLFYLYYYIAFLDMQPISLQLFWFG